MCLNDFCKVAFKLYIFLYSSGPREELIDRLKGYMMQVNKPFQGGTFSCHCVRHLQFKNFFFLCLYSTQTGILIGKPAEDNSMSSQVNKHS